LMVPWSVRPPVPVWVYSKPIAPLASQQALPEILPARCELDQVSLVPTPYDHGVWNQYCVELVERDVQRKTFTEKINKVIWRGAIHVAEVERSRMTLLQYVLRHNKDGDPAHLEFHELAEYRYHLDIGGLSGTAWGGLRWKLCTGLLVFKVESWANDWWYDTLQPWVHYIPVKPDVSDLHERYQWTQDNPEKAQEIAHAGRERCLETLGEAKAKEQYQMAVRQLPAAESSVIMEAELILEQMITLETDVRGIL
jgi:Glycosyl transferase family 90